MYRADDGVSSGGGILGYQAEANVVAVDDLMNEGSQQGGMGAGVEKRLLEAFVGVVWAQQHPRKSGSRAPGPQVFRSGFAAPAERAREEPAGRKTQRGAGSEDVLSSCVQLYREYVER